MKALCLILLVGVAAVRVCGEAQPPPRSASPQPFMGPANPTQEALDTYAELTGRTVLQAGALPRLPASIKAQVPADKNTAITFIESELAKNQIEVVRDGEMFVRALPVGWSNSPMGALLAGLKPPPPHNRQSGTNTLDFPGIDLETFLRFYTEFRERTILRPVALPMQMLRLRSQQPLTREEMIYAFNVVLALSRLAALDDGEKFVQVVPVRSLQNVQLRAPKPEPGAPAVDLPPGKDFGPAPAFSLPAPPSGAARRVPVTSRLGTPSRYYDPEQLVRSYAEMTGRTAAFPRPLPASTIIIRPQGTLTKAEVLYVIETLLRLDGLVLVPGDDNSVSAIPLGEFLNRPNSPPSKPAKL